MFVQDGFLYLIGTKHKLTVWRALPLSWLGSVPHGGPFHWTGSAVYLMEGPATSLAPQCI
jgi:hypothetical protein